MKYFEAGDNMSALKLFRDIAKREPDYRKVTTYVQIAERRLDEERRQALNEALRLEGEALRSQRNRNLVAAAAALSEARASFERARVLQASGVEKHIAENLARRRVVSEAALQRARTLANEQNYAEARRLLQVIVDLLPPGDRIRVQAEADLRRLP
jgi:hypothetical protein